MFRGLGVKVQHGLRFFVLRPARLPRPTTAANLGIAMLSAVQTIRVLRLIGLRVTMSDICTAAMVEVLVS